MTYVQPTPNSWRFVSAEEVNRVVARLTRKHWLSRGLLQELFPVVPYTPTYVLTPAV
jgi:hypothetical protein